MSKHSEVNKVETRKKALHSNLESLRAAASIHRERLARKSELLSSCEREISTAQERLRDAEARYRKMLVDIDNAPGIIKELDAKMDKLRQELATIDHAATIAKAKDLAAQILALQAAGYTVTPTS